MENIYDKLSKERKKMQENGDMPEWYTTGGWQLFKEKYMFEAKTVREQYERIAKTAAKHMRVKKPESNNGKDNWEDAFFELLWNGWLSPSTPVLANMGTSRGLPVSCSGTYIGDSIDDIYAARRETALLTKYGFGTAGYVGKIRPRGTPISVGGTSLGVLPVIKGFFEDMRYVSQGSSRRGAWAAYIEPTHGDFWELVNFIEQNPDDANLGWVIEDSFIKSLQDGDKENTERFQKAMKMKMVTGKGYYFFKDKANRLSPQMYKDKGLDVVASQLCSEILLHSSPELTYTCVLSSMNASKYREWKDTDAVFVATVFLDCVAEEFIQKARTISGLEKAVKFTELSRALGLGCAGLHTLFQKEMMPFGSYEAFLLNKELFEHLGVESKRASQWMAEVLGEPEWCKGYGVRNTHTCAIAPTKSTALIMGGISEGINPDPAMTFTQLTAAGEVDRANQVLLGIMKEKGIYDKKHIQELTDSQGSVQNVSWLSEGEKEVFKTAFEIDQEAILRLASYRQQYIDQGQSLNLFFDANEDESYIAKVHQIAFEDPNITALYYCYSKAGVTASKGECETCQ